MIDFQNKMGGQTSSFEGFLTFTLLFPPLFPFLCVNYKSMGGFLSGCTCSLALCISMSCPAELLISLGFLVIALFLFSGSFVNLFFFYLFLFCFRCRLGGFLSFQLSLLLIISNALGKCIVAPRLPTSSRPRPQPSADQDMGVIVHKPRSQRSSLMQSCIDFNPP